MAKNQRRRNLLYMKCFSWRWKGIPPKEADEREKFEYFWCDEGKLSTINVPRINK
jgi:hypothetical protein